MSFYITQTDGTLAMGVDRWFETLEQAVRAARRAAFGSPRYTGLRVMQEVPGRHRERAVVYPDRTVIIGPHPKVVINEGEPI